MLKKKVCVSLTLVVLLSMTIGTLCSCADSGNDLYDPSKIVEQKEAQYAKYFQAKFGTIDAKQDWGFGTSTSRAANTNSNEWANNWIVPGAVTEAEAQAVTQWFSENRNPVSETVNWTNFFVQFVSRGHGNMDQLVVNGNDHVNNFNATLGSIMLMYNTKSVDFGYFNSLDSQFHYEYTIQYINGSYYVGFDFMASGQNPNQQEAADGYYNDWIVKITEGRSANVKRIIVEDLGTMDDFDFNDVVFDVDWDKQAGKTIVTLQAAGGTLPLYIQIGGERHEVHQLFGVDVKAMVNTGFHVKDPVRVEFPLCNDISEVQVLVEDAVAGIYELKSETGKAPKKICVPVTYEWTAEREAIDTKYPKFKDWVGNSAINWLE